MLNHTTCTRAAALLALPLSLAMAAPAFAKGEPQTCDAGPDKQLRISGAELAQSLEKGTAAEADFKALTKELGTIGNMIVAEDPDGVRVVFETAESQRAFFFGEDGPAGCAEWEPNPWAKPEPCYFMAPGFELAMEAVDLIISIIEGDQYVPVPGVPCPPGYDAYMDTVTGEVVCLDAQGNEAPDLPEPGDDPNEVELPSCQSIYDAFFAGCVAPIPPDPISQLIGRGLCAHLAAMTSMNANQDGLCVD